MYPKLSSLQLPEKNIFNIRQNDYDQIIDHIEEMVQVPLQYGFTLERLEKTQTRNIGHNLLNTVRETIVLQLLKGDKLIDLSMQIPKLVDNQWFEINSRRKIPKYQLFDIPVLTIETKKKKEIRLQTNINRFSVSWKFKKKNAIDFFVIMNAFSKSIPLAVIMYAFYGSNKIVDKFLVDINEEELLHKNVKDLTVYQLLQLDLLLLSKDGEISKEECIQNLGSYLSERNSISRGLDYIFSMNNLLNIDVMTKQFIEEDNIVDCFVNLIKNDIHYDNVSYNNKRIRCFEYIVLNHFIKNIYSLCLNCRNDDKPKYNVSRTKILGDVNVSDIVHFDFAINPIDQIAQLGQISLTGPDGFEKKSVPVKLRDVNFSMKGKICPIDTPDRENCGVVQNLTPLVQFDDKLQFVKNQKDDVKSLTSLPILMVPFLEHTDQTRLQMAASQMKQSVLLQDFHTPLVASGVEKQYTENTSFLYIAKMDGEVLFVSKKFLIVAYNNGELKIIHIGIRPIVSENMDSLLTDLEQGYKFSKGETLAYSVFCKNDGLITIGQNFKVAFMSYYGYNHEDGIVISDRLVKDGCLTSQHYIDMSFNIAPSKVLFDLNLGNDLYTPLYPEGSLIRKSDIYASIGDMSVFNSMKHNIYDIFKDPLNKIASQNTLIENVDIFANEWYTEIREYDLWIQENIQQQIDKDNELIKVITSAADKSDAKHIISEHGLNRHSHTGKYRIKNDLIKGVSIRINGLYERPIQIGDKLANRHGNKGIVTNIVKQDLMPQTEDGSHVDICLNPAGVISRMNMGQLFELTLSKAVVEIKKQLTIMLKDKVEQKIMCDHLFGFIKLVDKSPDKWVLHHVKNNIPNPITQEYIDNIYVIQPKFESINYQDLEKIVEYTGIQYEEKIFEPITKKEIINKIATGYLYIMKLVHQSAKKLTCRSVGRTSQKTMQPTSGKSNQGGQKCGEMESLCLISNDMPHNHVESYTIKSDCIDSKNNFMKNSIDIGYQDINENPDLETETLKLLKANVAVLGIDISDVNMQR